jgi:hypothetical protein
MKRIYLILLLFVPMISSAQEHLLWKSKEEVRAAQKEANCPFIGTTITKLVMYDKFCYDSDFERHCFYWKDTCWKVSEARKLSLIDTIRQQLNASAKRVKKDQWTNKNATVRISLIKYKRQNEFLLDYVAIDKHKEIIRYRIGL